MKHQNFTLNIDNNFQLNLTSGEKNIIIRNPSTFSKWFIMNIRKDMKMYF